MDPNFNQPENNRLSKKNIVTFLVVGILFLSIPFAVKLVQQQQTIRSRAGSDPVTFSGPGVKCTGDECTTTSSEIKVELLSPFGNAAGIPESEASSSGGTQ